MPEVQEIVPKPDRVAKQGRCANRANQFFKLDGLVEMVTRRVSEDFNGFLANASGYQNTQFQKLICPAISRTA